MEGLESKVTEWAKGDPGALLSVRYAVEGMLPCVIHSTNTEHDDYRSRGAGVLVMRNTKKMVPVCRETFI